VKNGQGGDDKVHMADEYGLEDVGNMVVGVYRMEVLSRVGAVHMEDVANIVDVVHMAEEVDHRTWVSDDNVHMNGRLEENETA